MSDRSLISQPQQVIVHEVSTSQQVDKKHEIFDYSFWKLSAPSKAPSSSYSQSASMAAAILWYYRLTITCHQTQDKLIHHGRAGGSHCAPHQLVSMDYPLFILRMSTTFVALQSRYNSDSNHMCTIWWKLNTNTAPQRSTTVSWSFLVYINCQLIYIRTEDEWAWQKGLSCVVQDGWNKRFDIPLIRVERIIAASPESSSLKSI